MRVLFLAFGATRRRAVIEESAQVVADGGSALVLIDVMSTWRRETFPPGVDVVEVSKLEQRHLPRMLETLLLYRIPRGLLYRVIGHGPLRAPVRRVAKSYERRFADRIHRRVFLRLYRRLWNEARVQLIERYVLRGRSFDLIVVTDPLSLPDVVRLLDHYAHRGVAPEVAYSVDHVAA